MSELRKLKNMSPMSAEATVVRNYLDWMIDIPWYKKDEVDIDLNKASKILDEDHFGLEKVKERIIEYLAVQKRMQKLKGPILCLVGPPGVGKTSLGKSIANATGRKFVRMYVNNDTLNMGQEGLNALNKLFQFAKESEIIDKQPNIELCVPDN